MHLFHRQSGELYCEQVSVGELAERHGTPLYVYSQGALSGRYRDLSDAFGATGPPGLLRRQSQLQSGRFARAGPPGRWLRYCQRG